MEWRAISQQQPPDEGLTLVPGVSWTLGLSPPPAAAPGPILFLISAAMVMKACSTLVAFLALVSRKGMPSESANSWRETETDRDTQKDRWKRERHRQRQRRRQRMGWKG